MKIHYLGTCSGTEPMPNMHHCSLIFEIGGTSYWFDAGEGCAYTAYLAGIDLTATKCLFISHPHPDHICGLPHLLFCLNKLTGRYKLKMKHSDTLKIFSPDSSIVEAATVLGGSGGKRYKVENNPVSDGIVFDDSSVRVSAVHNRHLKETGESGWHSYSYLIEAENKRAVFSGDVLEPSELDVFVDSGCDILIMETGHHPVSSVCEYALKKGIKKLRFNHHGREILEGREVAERFALQFGKEHGMDIVICSDSTAEEL